MDSTAIIAAMISGCIIILFLMLFSKPLRTLLGFIVRAAVGMAAIYALNAFFPSVSVGINPATAIISGFLGIPGFAALIVGGIIL
ncbi:hypothetical protein IMSAG049_01024 [Clostridiales bacterium]|nr:hypothetical protein IMSAG049_01024 [Clostridiales bacterium]